MPSPSDDSLNAIWSALKPSVTYIVTALGGVSAAAIGARFGKSFFSGLLSSTREDIKEEKEDEKERRQRYKNLDNRRDDELDRSWKRINALEAENEEIRERRRLWEARARRADEIAHRKNHDLLNANTVLSLLGKPTVGDLTEIPLLEDPFK